MTSKDYQLIANAIDSVRASYKGLESTQQVEAVARTIAATFTLHYKRFDSARFLKACGIN